MLFNSLEFAVFILVAFGAYWGLLNKHLRLQNLFLLVASYIFYGWWDYRFLSLIVFSSVIDYLSGLRIGQAENPRNRKLWLALSMTCNLGLLGFFKYYNFFVESFAEAVTSLGFEAHPATLQVILPVGISFYTFQTMSYTIDVYRRTMAPEKDWVRFFAYVSFFPQLVAGPIERASALLPQFARQRTFAYEDASLGMRQILYGLFKKVVIADNCAIYVDHIFTYHEDSNGITLVLGIVMFAFQIYGDFSGYSDIAIGVARLLGFRLMTNFRKPYFSRDIAEFWRRWHISLSTWFRDYLYIPLGGSRGSRWKQIRNIFIIFLVSGFWHGANWTFVIWGGLNALFFLPLMFLNRNRRNLDVVAADRRFPRLGELLSMLGTFAITCLAWTFFRAQSVGEAWSYLKGIPGTDLFAVPQIHTPVSFLFFLPMLFLMLFVDWNDRRTDESLDFRGKWFRYGLYIFMAVSILAYMPNSAKTFIYFQF